MGRGEATLQAHAETARTYLPGGRPPSAGDVFANPAVARTLRQVGEQGRDAFYAGDLARAILACSARLGGTMVAADLAEFIGERIAPALDDVSRLDGVRASAERAGHLRADDAEHRSSSFLSVSTATTRLTRCTSLIEAKKLAYADMSLHLADPRFSRVPVDACSRRRMRASVRASSTHGARTGDVGPGRCRAHAATRPTCAWWTATATCVSLIQSNFANFGSGIVPDGLGFALQNRGGLFDLHAGPSERARAAASGRCTRSFPAS